MTLKFYFFMEIIMCIMIGQPAKKVVKGIFHFVFTFFIILPHSVPCILTDGRGIIHQVNSLSIFRKKKKKIFSRLQILQPPRKTACFPYLPFRPQNTTWWLRHDEIKPELKYWWSKFPSPCSSFLVYRPHITRISASFGMSLSITSIITPFPPRLSCLSGYANKYKFQFASPSR